MGVIDLYLFLVNKGGFLMVPLTICSILGFALILERSFYLLVKYSFNIDKILDYIDNIEKIEDINFNELKGSGITYLFNDVIDKINSLKEITKKEKIEEVILKAEESLEKNLTLLAIIAKISPLLGLLGTVTGMIKVFSAISVYGVGNPQVLSAGISEALLTTAAGLSIGIPCVIAYHFFEGRIDKYFNDLNLIAKRILENV